MLTVIKAINHFSNVFFLAPATSIFTRTIKICLLFPFYPLSGLKKTKQKSSQNLIIYKMYSYSVHMMRSLWESCSSLLAEDPKEEVGSGPSWFSPYICCCKIAPVSPIFPLCVCVCAMEKAHTAKHLHGTHIIVLSVTSQRQGNELIPVVHAGTCIRCVISLIIFTVSVPNPQACL